MFAIYDRDRNGSLDRDELREFMTELNGGIPVGDDAVDFVLLRVSEAKVDDTGASVRSVVFDDTSSYGIGFQAEGASSGEVVVAALRPNSKAAEAGIPIQASLIAFEAADGARQTVGQRERGLTHAQTVEQLRVAQAPVKLTFRFSSASGETATSLATPAGSTLEQCRVTVQELKPAIALWRFLQHETTFLDVAVDKWASGLHQLEAGAQGTGTDVTQLLQTLNDGILPTSAEVEWVLTKANVAPLDLDPDGSQDKNADEKDAPAGPLFKFELAKLKAAVALWYPHIYNRRHHGELRRMPSKRTNVGRLRRCVFPNLR
jgi:hypothetical protein